MTDIIPSLCAVILVLSLLGGALYLLKKRGIASFPSAALPFGRAAAAPRQLKVVERIPLGAQHALHLVRVGDRHILVATAPGSCQMMEALQKHAGQPMEGVGL